MPSDELAVLRTSIGNTPVEDWLTAQWAAIENVHTPEAKQAARTWFGRLAFYVWRLFLEISAPWTPDNLHLKFCEQLVDVDHDVPFGFISFNYDTFLDQAVQRVFGADLTTLTRYEHANLIKPHGSINWIVPRRPSDPELEPNREEQPPDYRWRFVFASGRAYNSGPVRSWDEIKVIPPGHRALENTARVFRWVLDQYLYPLVMLPLTTNLYDLAPLFPAAMITQAHRLLRQAEDIYVIGYRGRDQIFATMLEAIPTGARLHVVGRKTAQETADHILTLSSKIRLGSVHTEGFRGFVEAGSPPG